MEEDVAEYAKKSASWSWLDERTTLPESRWLFPCPEDNLRIEVISGTRFGVPWERDSFAAPRRDEEENEDGAPEEHSAGVAGRTSFATPQDDAEREEHSQRVVRLPSPRKTAVSTWKGAVVLPDRCISPRVLPVRETMMKKGKIKPPCCGEDPEAHQWAWDNWSKLLEELDND